MNGSKLDTNLEERDLINKYAIKISSSMVFRALGLQYGERMLWKGNNSDMSVREDLNCRCFN